MKSFILSLIRMLFWMEIVRTRFWILIVDMIVTPHWVECPMNDNIWGIWGVSHLKRWVVTCSNSEAMSEAVCASLVLFGNFRDVTWHRDIQRTTVATSLVFFFSQLLWHTHIGSRLTKALNELAISHHNRSLDVLEVVLPKSTTPVSTAWGGV